MKTNLPILSKAQIIGVALLTLTAVTASAESEDKLTKSFKVQPGGQLVVVADRGSIEVKTTDADSVEVEVARKARGSQSKTEPTFKDHLVTFTQDGQKVVVHSEYKGGRWAGWFGNRLELQVKYLITIPRKFDVDIKTVGGSIKVAELAGKVQAQTSGGSLNFAKIDGALSAHTSGGSITVVGCKGNADLKTSGGSLHLGNIEGDVDARTSGGAIHADKLTGKSVLKTSGGSIHISAVEGRIEAVTSGGGITATLRAQPTGDCTFKTSGGSITVALGEKLAVDIDAQTSGGRVSSDLPVPAVIQGEQKKTEIRGKVNGGGPLITAHTSGGSVHLTKN